MPVVVAVLQSLVYLRAVPVCVAFRLSTRGALRFGVGVSAFRRRAALRRAKAKPLALRRRRRGKGGARLLWRAIGRLRGADIRLRGQVSLGDAAATATACGALRALAAAVGSHAGRVEADITPLFGENDLCVDLTGMIRTRSGQIMNAIAMSGIDSISRRIAKWTDTRLKA